MKTCEVFIHIGYHKTGTTFLQRKIFPKLGIGQLMQPDVRYIAESQDYDPKRFISMLSHRDGLDSYDRVILSQETLSGRADGNPTWNQYLIADRLKGTFPNAKILVVIRNQPSYILSLYSYRVVVRGLERQDLSGYLRKRFESNLREKLQYDKLIEHYINLFTEEGVLVLAYEQLVEDHNKFVGNILGFMNIDAAIDYDPRRVNEGTLNSQVILTNRLFNNPVSVAIDFLRKRHLLSQERCTHLRNRYFHVKRAVVNPVLRKVFGKSTQTVDFDEEWKRHILSAFREGNHRLANFIDVDLPGCGYPW
jgi:hypothetical protein